MLPLLIIAVVEACLIAILFADISDRKAEIEIVRRERDQFVDASIRRCAQLAEIERVIGTERFESILEGIELN